jgi:L-ascorbate metabolism protein UlaG (beta-lactamase superfamily)
MKRRSITIKLIISVVVLLIAGSAVTLMSCASFGARVSGQRLERVKASRHAQDGKFLNANPLSSVGWGEIWHFLGERLLGDQLRHPPSAIPIVSVQPGDFTTPPPPGLRAIWIGHSSVLVELDGVRFLVDPVFSEYASPFQWIGPKRFQPPPIRLEDLPPIAAVLTSHDHYDHLDMHTVQHLAAKGTHFFVPLGIGAHLEEWSVPPSQITDLDWWESKQIDGVTFACTPAQHYSGRGPFDRMETLWASWSVIGPEHRAFYSGDTGFSDHFQKIGERYGPFDLSILKIGAYGPMAYWHDVHIDPEGAVQAHLALQARYLLPVHWATFNLGLHAWDEPIKRAVKVAKEYNIDLLTPRIGEIVTVGQPFRSTTWWEDVQ